MCHRNEIVCLLESGPTATPNVFVLAVTALSESYIDHFFLGPPTRTCELLKKVHVFFGRDIHLCHEGKGNKPLAQQSAPAQSVPSIKTLGVFVESIGFFCLSTVLIIVKMYLFVC